MEIRLYHNPRCSKSRQALQLLRERGVEPVVIEYLKTPPRREEIDDLLAKLGAEPRELMRSNEPEYAALGLARAELSREQLIQALLDNPKLLQRPIAVAGDRAVIGRPPERVLELLER
jgi:arsenate reductase (glutaredoxin)